MIQWTWNRSKLIHVRLTGLPGLGAWTTLVVQIKILLESSIASASHCRIESSPFAALLDGLLQYPWPLSTSIIAYGTCISELTVSRRLIGWDCSSLFEHSLLPSTTSESSTLRRLSDLMALRLTSGNADSEKPVISTLTAVILSVSHSSGAQNNPLRTTSMTSFIARLYIYHRGRNASNGPPITTQCSTIIKSHLDTSTPATCWPGSRFLAFA